MDGANIALFSAEGTDVAANIPALLGGKCNACGAVFFPMQTYGCQVCGSKDLAPQKLTGRGTLICSAPVFMSMNPALPAPFTVGSIELEDGPKVRTMLAVEPGTQLTPGDAMEATLVPQPREGKGEHDLRFAPTGNGN